MKKITFLLSFIFLNVYFLFSQDDKKALDMLNSMSDNYKKMKGFTSSFTYSMKNLTEDITDSFSGKISVRDDKYVLYIEGQKIINDSKTVWTYLEDLNEVTISDFDASEQDISINNVFEVYKEGYKHKFIDKVNGINNVEKIFSEAGILKNNNFYDPENLSLVHHINQALRANLLFKKDTDYIVRDGKVQIIDEFTGRVLDGRRFSDGLHQAIEAKENVKIEEENQTLASITYQNYFRLYKKLSGMTGTALTEAEEFFNIYKLNVLSIPTNKKMIRKDWNDQIFRTEIEKNNAIVSKIAECNNKGQPILIFTSSINKSEVYSDLLKKEKIKHVVLNAKNHEKEAEIIANAGKKNSVIITTSISGRGVDIQLGGKKDEIDENIWTIPAERMKAKIAHRIPLTERCIEILEEAKRISSGSDYIFYGYKKDKSLSENTFNKLRRN